MDQKILAELLDELLTNRISQEDAKRFVSLMDEPESRAKLEAIMETRFMGDHYEIPGDPDRQESIRQLLLEKIGKPKRRVIPVFVRYAAAAAILFAIATTYFIINKKQDHPAPVASVYKNDVAPGKPGAKLKLSGGRILQLDSLTDGLIASEGGYQIYKQNGEIIYKGNASAVTEVLYNELIADKKQMSSATLPDGTIAWVNAASSVRYPVHFTGSERKVTMTGEAIFKVKHNEKQPFRVFAGDKVFEDKGTEFDINAYNTNVITATVAEGLVQTGNVGIKAGQQATVDERGKINISANADMETIFAWRDGQFTFSNATIEEVMKQAELWYDIEVVYEGRTDQRFIFSADRSKPISNLLHKIEESSGVHFEIDGRKVTVRP